MIIMCHFAGLGQVTAVFGKFETENPYGQSVMATQQEYSLRRAIRKRNI